MTRFFLLGTGSSAGVPVIGCPCAVCNRDDPKQKRLRTSALLETSQGSYLIDPGPDFRQQALSLGKEYFDKHPFRGVFITHSHYDHIGGLDDLRVFNFRQNRQIPVVLSGFTYQELRSRYSYIFEPKPKQEMPQGLQTIPVSLECKTLEACRGQGHFDSLHFKYCQYLQGSTPVLGFRFGPLAYITDIKTHEEDLEEMIKGVEILVISGALGAQTRLHLHIDEAVHLARSSGAKSTYITHISHDIDPIELEKRLPANIFLGFDGQVIQWQGE